jgi:hypothetical protein
MAEKESWISNTYMSENEQVPYIIDVINQQDQEIY